MYKLLFLLFLTFGLFAQGIKKKPSSGDSLRGRIEELRYKKNMAFLDFFQKKYYDKANEKIDKLKEQYKVKQALYDIETDEKKKKKLEKQLTRLKQKFEVSARIIRYYNYTKKYYEANYKKNRVESSKYRKLSIIAKLEYEEWSGREFKEIMAEYNKYRYQLKNN